MGHRYFPFPILLVSRPLFIGDNSTSDAGREMGKGKKIEQLRTLLSKALWNYREVDTRYHS
jgi:hypothetical protein